MKTTMKTTLRKGFTLLELLIVIAILGVLVVTSGTVIRAMFNSPEAHTRGSW